MTGRIAIRESQITSGWRVQIFVLRVDLLCYKGWLFFFWVGGIRFDEDGSIRSFQPSNGIAISLVLGFRCGFLGLRLAPTLLSPAPHFNFWELWFNFCVHHFKFLNQFSHSFCTQMGERIFLGLLFVQLFFYLGYFFFVIDYIYRGESWSIVQAGYTWPGNEACLYHLLLPGLVPLLLYLGLILFQINF